MCRKTQLKTEIKNYLESRTSFYYLTEIVFGCFGSFVSKSLFVSECGTIKCKLCANNHLIFSFE